MDLNQKVIFKKTVFTQEIDGEMVLLDMTSEHYFGLDEVGTSIWKAFKDTASLVEVLDILLDEYDIDRENLEKDISFFIKELSDSGLIALESL